MTRLERSDQIETLVGAKRHPTMHLARAISAEQRVYLLHPDDCLARGIDFRSCEYSEALDHGIDLDAWDGQEDQVARVLIDPEHYDLLPAPAPPAELETTAALAEGATDA